LEIASKRLDLLRTLVPQATTVGFLSDPRMPTAGDQMSDMLGAARALGREVIVVESCSDRDFEAAFATLVQRRADALLIGAFPLFFDPKVVALAARYRIPTMYSDRIMPFDGGLISYGANEADSYRLGGIYVGRILKGEKPANLPVMQPTKFDLVINLKTAKALGLTVPETLLATADEIIQ
jgi:putative tryptophan/tyrosine transport system substrate-binding protein